MKYLSLFSGIGGFEKAIQDILPSAECVGYSEIDKFAIQIYQKHFPNHCNFGDITKIDIGSLPDFDLLVGGSPCQDLSIAKKNRKGLDGSRSGLFYKYVEILQKKQPKYFILENVASMPKETKDKISEIMGVQPIIINAALVSAQQRKRLFWTNILNVTLPEDRGIFLKDILINGIETKSANGGGRGAKTGLYCIAQRGRYNEDGSTSQKFEPRLDGKTNSLTTVQKDNLVGDFEYYRKLHPIECERLQSFPDGWTEGISNTQRYKTLGNAVNVEVVKHILSFI